jgi:1-acyl-sn-glycerol-3-phosphate acyltransferase
MRKIFVWLFQVKGWKMDVSLPPGYEKCVVIAAPHTSNWDFLFSMAVFFKLKIPIRFLAKKELFRWPLKGLLKSVGGMEVQRSSNNKKLVDEMISLFQQNEKLMLMIPAEGTRGRVKRWKTGFYHVALAANVPVLLGYLDYGRKVAGFGPLLYMTGNPITDAENIKLFYKNIKAKYPENFNLEGLVLKQII